MKQPLGRIVSLVAPVFLGLALTAFGQSLSPNPRPQPPSGDGVIRPPGPASISQSASTAVVSGASVSCNAGGIHTDNSYYRAFTLSAFNPPLDSTQFSIQSVTFGVEVANDGGGAGQPITLRLYDSSANPPTNATIGAALRTANATITDQSLTLYTMTPATPLVLLNASDILAVEVFTPNGSAGSHSFFIGSNSAGQTGPSFIRAADCGISEITNLTGIGFPNMHIVMTVSGNNQLPVELQTITVQ